jgi:hypothetical protein
MTLLLSKLNSLQLLKGDRRYGKACAAIYALKRNDGAPAAVRPERTDGYLRSSRAAEVYALVSSRAMPAWADAAVEIDSTFVASPAF